MATKSLVLSVQIDIAERAHNCQANDKHRITRGDSRLKVRNGRSWDHYCRSCALAMIARGIDRLEGLRSFQVSEKSA
jgi:hypothetical protein